MSIRPTVLCFGEALWDSSLKGLFLGGAPTNVAYHLHQLGVGSQPVSAVGNDYLGEEILRRISAWDVTTKHIGMVPNKRTGVVQVDLTRPNSPTYSIIDDVAWDYIPETDNLLIDARKADAIVFGTLALRRESNEKLLRTLIDETSGLRVFDVNLRPPYYSVAQTLSYAQLADLIKLNLDELGVLHPVGIGEIELMAASFSQRVGGKQVCVTNGSMGAGFWDGKLWHWEPAQPIKVKGDAVGAGDAFLAALVSDLTTGKPVTAALKKACRLAELIASSDGAQPVYDALPFVGS